MGISTRRDETHAEIKRAQLNAETLADALATVERFNSRLAAGRTIWFWPTVGAALITKHHWLSIVCDSCGTIIEMDLTVKRRDPDAPISLALKDTRCPRCNGHGRTRVAKLSKFPS